MSFVVNRGQVLAACILSTFFLTATPADADSTYNLRPPPVVQLIVTCKYVQQGISPLTMMVEGGYGPTAPFLVEFKDIQTGVVQTIRPVSGTDIKSPASFHFPLLQLGVYDLIISWINPQTKAPDMSKGVVVYKGLKIPTIRLTGGRGTGCQV